MKIIVSVRTLVTIAALIACQFGLLRAVDIAPMNWTPRSTWINVKSPGVYTTETTTPNAVGDGVTDDTAAIQGVLNWVSNVSGRGPLGRHPTVFFPSGTYKISATLKFDGSGGNYLRMYGNGLNTTIKWYGPSGGAMFWPDSGSGSSCVGFVWDGNSIAGCGVLEYSDAGYYMTGIRHENESFKNFVTNSTYLSYDSQMPNGYPGTGIISGLNQNPTQPCGEVTILNCHFSNCTVGVWNPVDIFNNFVWLIDGCEFDNCGVGADLSGCSVILNSHFQQSTIADLGAPPGAPGNGGGVHAYRLTSSGSAQFFNGQASGVGLHDSWVDGWTNPTAAVQLNYTGMASLTHLTFTNPPAGALPPIYGASDRLQFDILSDIVAPDFPSSLGLPSGEAATYCYMYNGLGATLKWVPPGALKSNITSPTQTFLKSSYPADSTNIIDVTAAPYNADANGVNDATVAVQAAISAAQSANNNSCVFFPAGLYKITSTLNLSGGNYSLEGDGGQSILLWYGTSGSNVLAVSNPQNIAFRFFHIAVPDTTTTAIRETATGASNATYDSVNCDGYSTGNIWNTWANPTSPGLCLDHLPAGSVVYVPVLTGSITSTDSAQAEIFVMRGFTGCVTATGATNPKTGRFGLATAEGGVDVGRPLVPDNPTLYNFRVTDDQNLIVGPYYSEQSDNGIILSGDAGSTPGQVAVDSFLESPSAAGLSVDINNYAGSFFYNQANIFGGFSDPGGAALPPSITQTGSNPVTITLTQPVYNGGNLNLSLDTGGSFIAAYGDPATATDVPNPLSNTDLKQIAEGFDEFLQLGALDLAVEYGIVNENGLVAYWKLDEPVGPSADSSMSLISGTWINNPGFTTDHPQAIPHFDRGSMTFNGASQCVSMGNPTGLPSGRAPRTLCGWGKADNTNGGWRWIAAYGSPGGSQAMFIGMNGTSLDGGAYGDDLIVPNFWDNLWHFIALTYDGTTAKLYADGNLVASDTRNWNLVPYECLIGEQVNNAGEYWVGSIDDVRIYNRALSQSEIAQLAGVPNGVGSLIGGVFASSTSGNVYGTPQLTTSNNSLIPGASDILGASDSLGDTGINQDDLSSFGTFLTNLSGANITYDLGANFNVTNLLIWNYSQPGAQGKGANSVTVESSTDNVNFTTVGTYTFNEVTQTLWEGSERPLPGNNPPHPTGGPAVVKPQVLPVSIASARYIRLLINSNWGDGSGQVGLNEVNFLGTPVAGATFDLAGAFNSIADSTTNEWSYGTYSTAGAPDTFNIPSTLSLVSSPGNLNLWLFPPSPGGSDPNIEINPNATAIYGYGIDFEPGKVSFGPYQGPAVARFTVPVSGHYNITAHFQTDQIRGTETSDGTTAYVYIGGKNFLTQELVDPGSAQFGTPVDFSQNNVELTAGETLDFTVGQGAFTTQVDATMTFVSP